MDRDKQSENKSFVSFSELAFLLYFTVMLGAKAIGFSEGETAYNVCLVIGAAFFGLKLLLTRHTIAEYIMIGLFLLLGVLVYRSSGEKSLLIFFTMMLGVKPSIT